MVDAVRATRYALIAKEVGSPPHTKVTIAVASLQGSVSVVLQPREIRATRFGVTRASACKCLRVNGGAGHLGVHKFQRSAESGQVMHEDSLESLRILGASSTGVTLVLKDTTAAETSPGR